jgi:sulfide dehydrogenase [flavocytochrome c] flavoprotein subunit
VVVVGGGYGGATAAKYVRLLSDYKIDVVLIEPNEAFVSCPISNLVLGGSKQMADITTPYSGLAKNHGVTVVKDCRQVHRCRQEDRHAGRGRHHRLRQAGGVTGHRPDVRQHRRPAGRQQPGQILQAWKAGPETWPCAGSWKRCPTAASMH